MIRLVGREIGAVSFTAMPNAHHLYHFGPIVDLVDNAIVAYAVTSIATRPCNFLAPSRSWVLGKCLQMGDDSFVDSARKGFKSRFGGAFKKNLMHPSLAP
jgi:hypothetical protein